MHKKYGYIINVGVGNTELLKNIYLCYKSKLFGLSKKSYRFSI